MLRKVLPALLILCLCAAGCAAQGTAVPTQIPTPTAADLPVALPTEPIVPETVEPAIALPVATEETGSNTAEETASGPSSEDLTAENNGPCHFYDDAAFLGDSISYSLMLHHTKTKDFGEAQFLVRDSIGVHNAVSEAIGIFHQGKIITPWDALKITGAKKVFIMLGINDVSNYGIDSTIEKWGELLQRIRTACPDIQVYIQAQTPMWNLVETNNMTNEKIDQYNQRLKEFAEANGCVFLDLTACLKDSDNRLADAYTSDYYVHMNTEGTAVWAKALKEYGFQQEKETP